MDALAIVFDDWEQVLTATLPPDLRKPYREAIVKFRYWLRQTGKTPDAETFKEHLEWKFFSIFKPSGTPLKLNWAESHFIQDVNGRIGPRRANCEFS